MAVFDDMEKDFQQTAVQPQQAARGPFTSSAMQEPSVEDLEREMAEMGYRQGHDSEGILPMLYHTGAGVIGKTLEDIGGFMAYGGKPSYMTEKEWDKKAQDAGGLAAVANAINAGIRDYGREISEAHQRNYTPYSAKWFANSLGYLIPSAVQLAAVKKTGMFEPSAGEKMMLEGAGNVIANAASKVPVMAKYAPKIGSVAAGLAENATIGAKEAFPEAFMEAEDAKNSYIEKAKMNKTYVPEQTEREAEEVSKKVLMDNIAFITSTDTLQNYIMDRISGGKGSAMQKMGRAALAGAPVGFTEEAGQGIIQKEAAGEPWKLSDPDIGGAGLVGAIAGSFPTGARMAMDYAGNKYMERQQAKNIKNMGQGEAITEQPTEAEEVTGTDNIRNMAESMDEDNSGNPPTPPAAPAAEMASPAERGVNITNEVTLNEFPDAVATAMNDRSTNPVQRIRNLTGVIPHNASDGTNCVRTIGLAYAGTDYGDAINVDQLVETAREKGQLQDPADYQPRPGDIAIIATEKYPDGGHAVVVTENGGTIQNGQSADGVYESEKSPSEMFGNKVVSYIRASEEFANTDNVQAGNDVFAEFAVPENAFSDNPAAEELFPANREQQQAEAPAEMAAQQDAQEAAMAAEQGIIEPAENFMDDNLPPEIKSFNRAQLVDFAKGIQAIKRRFEAKKMSAEEALQARDNLFNRIASKRPETAQKVQNVPANVVNNPLPANMIQQAPQNQATAPNRATVPAVNNTAAVPQNTATQDRFQEAAERFNNDPALLQRVAKAARQRLKEMHEAGQMTDDQLQANIAELGNSFRQIKKRMTQNNRKAQQPTGQGRQARLPMGMMEANAKAAMQRAKQAGIKEKDIPMLTRITKAAATGNQAAISQFSKLRPEVRQAMQDIITGALPVNDALRSRRETPALEAPAVQEQTAVPEKTIDNEQKHAQVQEKNNVPKTEQTEETKQDQQIQTEEGQQEAVQGKQEAAEPAQKKAPEKTEEQERPEEAAAIQEEETKTEPVKEESPAAEQKEKAPESQETAADNLDDKVNKLIEKEFKDPEERELASSIFLINPDDAKGEWASWRKSYRDELNKILAPVMKVLRGGMKQGVEFVRMEGERDAKYNRVSQNAEWYRNFYKENKRAPKDSIEAAERDGHITTELEDIAIDVLTGKRKDVIPEYASGTPEAKAENNKNSLEISDILHNIEMLDNIRDGVFKIADALNGKPAETKPAAKPEKTVQAPAGKKKIEDFGQKIGGARKDMYVKGEKAKPAAKPKTEKKTDDSLKDKPWLKDYDIKQGENGKWTVTDKKEEEKRKRNSFIFAWYNGNKRAIEKLFFDTKEAAQKAATLDAVSQKHTVFSTNEKGNFCISRKIGGREGHWVQIKDGFATRDEAMTYMANHPEEIMSIRTSYGESDLATPVIHGWNDARSDKAPERLKKGQNATEGMFTDTFGFRGVQFGNWNNQTERQSLMNAAYEGLLDLADVLGVDPKIVSLNGELGLAFGARGKGLTGARAHYEPAYTVINLTKMKGAGSLAHEWMHALDHYLMLKSGTIKGDRTDEGRLTDPNFAELASEVSSWRFKSDNLNPDLLAAFKKLKDTAFYKEVAETQDEADAQEWVNRTSSRMDEELNKIRQYVANERKYGAKKAPATAEQLQRFDELATKIAAGDEQLTVNHKYHTWTTPTMEKLSDLFKEITGKSLLKMDPDDRFIRLVSLTDTLQEKRKKLAEAQAKVEKKKRVPTAYYRNNTDLDRGRTSNYWTRPTEMLARAFSAFVEDTVNEKGYNSEFLSYGSDNKYFMWGNPFPEGKEREAINSAFKDFIGEVQKEVARNKEATGEIKFSIRAAANETKNEIPNTEKKRQIRAKEELEKSEPVITIKRDDELPQLEDKALRSRAKEMFRQLYPETDRRPYSTTTKYGEEIYIPMSGFKELRNHSADNRVMYIVPHLETILNNSTYLFTPEDKAFKIYGCKAMINGQECYVRSVVRRRDDGKYYYDGDVSTVEDIKNKSPLPSNEPGPKPGIAAEKDSYPENSIPYWMDRVNEWENDPALAENEDTRRNDLTDDAVRLSGESINRAVSDVIAEVQEAFPGAKDVEVDGTDITFTLPNGLQMRVKIKEQILLSDSEAAKARKAHGLKDDADITAEGSSKKLDKGSVIELSQESSEGTAFHEAFHTAMDWVFNPREKKALKDYYGPKAKELGKSLDETLADAYKEWIQARKERRGTVFGKLWQKIKDFAKKIQAILTRTENVNSIFRKLETGDVWNREAQNTQVGDTQFAVQEYTSADTSLNQIPSVFKRVKWQDGTTNIDIGGGRYDKATNYMKEQGVSNVVFDPFNRDAEHNRKAFEKIQGQGDTVTVANVLNVIKEDGIRDNVILQAAKALKPDGTAYFGIYEGDESGNGRATSKGWQNNKKAAEYVPEIAKHFKTIKKSGNMIIAQNPIIKPGETAIWSMDTNPENDIRYSVRERLNEATKPEPVKYGNNDTAFGRATQVISAKTEKSLFQKGLDAVKNLYFQMVDEDTHAHKVDQKVEAKTGKKLSADESFYNQVRETGSISRGHAEALIAGTKAHAETVQSRIRNKYLKEQFDPEATLSNMMDIIDPVKMNEKHGDFLAKHNLKDWQQALDTYLAAHRLKEMYSLAMADYNVKHKKWQERKNAAWKAGKEFTEKEPMPYRLPGKLTIADLDAAIKAAPPELEQAAKVYYAFNKNLTIQLADAGLLKPELYQMLNTKYKRYCPLMRDFSDTAAADDFIGALGKGGSSVVNVSNPLKEILEEGSKRNLLSPLESTIKACAIYCDRAERNKVGQKAVKMAQDYKLDDLIWRVDGKKAADPKNCIFTVMINGQKVAFQCTQDLYEPIVGAPEQVADMLFSLASLPAKTLRYGATISPTFAIRNMIRDTVFAGIASKNGFIPIYDTVRGFIALRSKPELKAKFDAMGISMQTFYGNEMTARTKLQDLQVKEIDNLWDFAKEIIKYPMKKLEAFSEMSEQSTRMGEFMRAIEKGKSLEEAARDARNLTIDFSRHGRTGKKLNQIIPFFNAAIQGGDLMARLLYNDPAGTLLKLGKYIVLPSMALWCLNKDDDWWKELDPDLKNSYWFVKTPKGIVRVPKPQEAGVLFGSGMEALLEQATKRDPEAMANWADAFRGAITPNYLATVISPLLENAANYSFFRNKPIVGRANEKKPGEQQFTSGTSELSKMLGASPIAHAYNKGGYSPSKIDNLIRGYTGTMGMLLWQGAGEAANKARGIENQSPEKKISEMPFVREFLVSDYNMSRSLNDFYDLAEEAEAHHNAHGKKGHPSPAVAFVRKARADIAKERKAIQEITSSRRLTPEQKRQLIDKRQNKINIIAKGTLKRYQGKF